MMRRVAEAAAHLLLALWFGSYAGFAIVAPVLFRAGLSRQEAGDVAGRMIERLTLVGLIAGGVALLLLVTVHGARARMRVGLTAAALAAGLYLWVAILPPLRAPLPKPIDQYLEADPVRVEYNRLHKRSERVASVTLLLVAGALAAGAARKE